MSNGVVSWWKYVLLALENHAQNAGASLCQYCHIWKVFSYSTIMCCETTVVSMFLQHWHKQEMCLQCTVGGKRKVKAAIRSFGLKLAG